MKPKRKIKARAREPRTKPPAAPSPGLKITPEMLAWSKQKAGITQEDRARVFTPYEPGPFVFPKGKKPAKSAMAMDEASFGPGVAWAAQSAYNLAFSQGYTFLGYQVLAEMAQIPEYRTISEVIATDMTRKWIKIQSEKDEEDKKSGGSGEQQAERIQQLEAELERLDAREHFRTIAEQDGFFGRTHLYIDTGATDDRKELMTPIGDGQNDTTMAKLKKGDLKALRVIEPVWCYPANYNANNPLKNDWYNPISWFCMGTELHRTRLLTFVGRAVPDLLKPAFSFGGLSMTQMAKPYVDNWLQTRQSVSDLIHAFSVMVLKTDLETIMQNGSDQLQARAQLFNNLRDNKGLMMINKDSEDFANVSASLGTLDKLQAQAQEHICSVSRIPLVKYTGISPTGLNASSEGEIRVYYDTIHAHQEKFFRPHLQTVFDMAQINIWGAIDDDLSFDFEPLWELDELEEAKMRESQGKMNNEYIDRGVLSPQEVRQSIASDANSPFSSLDVSDVPEMTEPLPKNIKETEQAGPGGEGPEGKKPEPAKKDKETA